MGVCSSLFHRNLIMKRFITFLVLLVSATFVESKPQYDSRGILGIAVDRIVEDTNLRISIALQLQKWVQDCNDGGWCGYGAYCFLTSNDGIACKYKRGFKIVMMVDGVDMEHTVS